MYRLVQHVMYGLACGLQRIPILGSLYGLRERLRGPWALQGKIWMHGASLGECGVLLEVIRRLEPSTLIITTQKCEVRDYLRNKLPTNVQIALAPLDHPKVMERFFASGIPRRLVLAENELWPGWIKACKDLRIPVAIISGRMSPKGLARWRRWAPSAMSQALQSVNALWVQEPQDAKRFQFFSATPVPMVTGDWKWLGVSAKAGPEWVSRSVDLTLISVHREEWQALEEGILKHVEFGGDCVLIPRIPGQAPWFRRKLQKMACPVVQWPDHCRGAVSIVAEFGRVDEVLAQSRLALVGGSFCRFGVHNVREPLRHGVPVLVGPVSGTQTQELSRLEAEGVLCRISDLSLLCIGREGKDLWVSGWFPWEAREKIHHVIQNAQIHSDQYLQALQEWLKTPN